MSIVVGRGGDVGATLPNYHAPLLVCVRSIKELTRNSSRTFGKALVATPNGFGDIANFNAIFCSVFRSLFENQLKRFDGILFFTYLKWNIQDFMNISYAVCF